MPISDSKLSLLMETKEQKLKAFEGRNKSPVFTDSSLDSNSYKDLGNGYIENNGNKIWGVGNDFTPQELGFATDYIIKNYSLPNESTKDRRFYQYGVTDEGSTIPSDQPYQREGYAPTKFGLQTGTKDTQDARYLPKEGGWAPGTMGVDITKKAQDVNLQYSAATALEALYHTNKNALANRLVRARADGFYDYDSPTGMRVINGEEKNALFGSGASEYYSNQNSFVDRNYDPASIDQQKVITAVNKAIETVTNSSPYAKKLWQQAVTPTLTQEEKDRINLEYTPGLSRLGNMVSGLGAEFTNSLIVSPAMAVAELTGMADVGSAEKATKKVEELFGYNPEYSAITQRKTTKDWNTIWDEKASTADRVRAVGRAIYENIVTPEQLGTSVGVVLSWVTPGVVLQALGYGVKGTQAALAIDKALEAGTISKQAALAQKAKLAFTAEGAKKELIENSGHLIAAIGEVNKQYGQFVQNNGGVELEGADKAAWFQTRLPVQLVNQKLEQFTDIKVLHNAGLLAAAGTAVKHMTNKEFAAMAAAIGKGMASTIGSMGLEAAQEYAQTTMELFNSRYGQKLFKDTTQFIDFITDERNVTEAGVAALAGAGGAVQFEAAGRVLPVTGQAISAASSLFNTKGQKGLNNTAIPNAGPSLQDVDTIAPLTEQETKAAKKAYGTLLTRTANNVASGITADNLSALLDDIEEINRTKHVISTSPEEQQKAGEIAYNNILDSLEEFIKKNPEAVLTKRLVRKQVAESVKDLAEQSVLSSIPEKAHPAIIELARVMGDGTPQDFETSAKRVARTVTTKQFAEAVPEADALGPYLTTLEQSLTGSVSPDLATTYTVLKKALQPQPGKPVASTGQNIPSIVRQDSISNEDVKNNPKALYIFGDNDARAGKGGQAKAMRGEPNTVGVRTKAAPSQAETAYWSDDTYAENVKKIDEDFAEIETKFKKGGYERIVLPSAGLGTGLASLQKKAPKTFTYLQSKIAQLEGKSPDSNKTPEAAPTVTTPAADTPAASTSIFGKIKNALQPQPGTIATASAIVEGFKRQLQPQQSSSTPTTPPQVAPSTTPANNAADAAVAPSTSPVTPTSTTGAANVLGSSPTSEGSTAAEDTSSSEILYNVQEELVDYTDDTRVLDSERLLHVLLGSGRKYDEEFKKKLNTFARSNKLTDEVFNSIVKNYEQVDEEAVRGDRGYAARLTRLKALATSSNPNKTALQQETRGLVSMLQSIAKSVAALSDGIEEANNIAAQNNRKTLAFGKLKPLVTRYMKYNSNTRKYDDPYLINFKKDADNKWVADVAGAKDLLARKKAYVEAITKGLHKLSGKINAISPDALPVFGAYVVPVTTGKGNKVRDSDAAFIKNIGKVLESIGLSSVINKIILGNEHTAKWSSKGDYYKANNLLINQKEYSSDDVVLVNSVKFRKSGPKFNITDLVVAESKRDTATEAQSSFMAAVEAGATLVLDKELTPQQQAAIFRFLISKRGYVKLEGATGTILVKKSEANEKMLQARSEELKKEAEAKKTSDDRKSKLIDIGIALSYAIDPTTGEQLTEEKRSALQAEYDTLLEAAATADFKGNKENVQKFVDRQMQELIKEKASSVLKDANPVPVSFTNKALEEAVNRYIAEQENNDAKSQEVLQEWKQLVEVEQPNQKTKEGKLKAILAKLNTVAKGTIESILTERSFSLGKKDVFEYIYMGVESGKALDPEFSRTAPTEEQLASIKDKKVVVRKGKKSILLSARRVVQDPTKLVKVTNTTVLNSIPVHLLPFGIRDAVASFMEKGIEALGAVSEAELAEQTDARDVKNKFLEGNGNLYNSPSRGIIFNKDGKANPEVIAAMYLAIGDMLKTDLGKLTRGYKTDADIALMFGVQEHEVTDTMRKFAKENGVFLKTAANSVGKAVLQQLGLTRVVNDDASFGEYENLVADIGNATLLVAEKHGLLERTSVLSDALAKAFKDGTELTTDAKTYFVNVKDKEETVRGFKRKVPTKFVTDFSESYSVIAGTFPEAQLNRKEPYFQAPTEERIDNATSDIRNDILGLDIPQEAKTTLELFMKTPYTFASERVKEFLDLVDAKDSQIKSLLGYIPLNSPEFESLYFKDKEVQEVKNREIEKSIEELRMLQERVAQTGTANPDMYFNWYYMGNNRYGLDSNTINPQTDKLVRFLIVPKSHEMSYTTSKNSAGGLLFTATSSTGTQDQSYTVRMALGQAFGQGVDKMNPQQIIAFGDAVLSLSLEQVVEAKRVLMKKGKVTLTDTNGNKYKLEAEHITHTLQALNFLVKLKTSDGAFTSSLSLEFDSLTSGFANKTQQMPILTNMDDHFMRVGVITEEKQNSLRDNPNFGGAGTAFDPKTGQSVSDLLQAGKSINFYDSYQNLARISIEQLKTNEVQSSNLSHPSSKKGGISGMGVFNAIKAMLPGGEFLEKEGMPEEIKGVLRNLFKDPFMIFNYSAGINRIVKNLGFNVANNMFRDIATRDLADPENVLVKDTVDKLLKAAIVYVPEQEGKKQVTTAEEFQKLLRAYPLKAFKVKPFAVGSTGNTDVTVNNVEDMVSTVVRLTYGEVVKGVFENEFGPFISVQNSMNDAFKVAFRIFDHKRMQLLQKTLENSKQHILTAEDHAKALEVLWDEFPWIVGPLTSASSKKDVIAVATTSVRSPRSIESGRAKPQTILGKGYDAKTSAVNPLIRYLEEAVSAGAVLPFHALDGAEMSFMVNGMAEALGVNEAMMLGVHDATIPPIDQQDLAGFTYQKGMQHYNKNYSLGDALEQLGERISATVESKNFSALYKDLSAKGLKATDNKDIKFPEVVKIVLQNLKSDVDIIKKAREQYYGKDGKLKNAYYGNLVSTPGAMYQEGMIEPDLSYKEVFKERYKEVPFDSTGIEITENTVVAAINKSALSDIVKKNLIAIVKNTEKPYNEVLTSVLSTTANAGIKTELQNIVNNISELGAAIANLQTLLSTETIARETMLSEAQESVSKTCK